MRIIVDANIFVSAILRGGIPNAVVRRVYSGADTMLVSDEIIREIENVITRPKFGIETERIEYTTDIVRKISELIFIPPELSVVDSECRDPKDIKYLKCAVAGKADYIISGDKDLNTLKEYRSVKIVKPREYLDIITHVSTNK